MPYGLTNGERAGLANKNPLPPTEQGRSNVCLGGDPVCSDSCSENYGKDE